MELTMGQHYCWKGMRDVIQQVCKTCMTCKRNKKRKPKWGLLEPKVPETIPWHTLCIDLIGPYPFGTKKDKSDEVKLHCLTMIDPATGWFEIVDIPTKRADDIVNLLEFTWLTRYPWPTEIIMDRGKNSPLKFSEQSSTNMELFASLSPRATHKRTLSWNACTRPFAT